MKHLIKAELLRLKDNGKAVQSYKQKLNRLLDSRQITFEDWQKTGTFCEGSRMEKLYGVYALPKLVLRYAGGIIIHCTKDESGNPNYTYEGTTDATLGGIEKKVWNINNSN